MSSPEYKLRYADHIRRHLFNGGALTPAATIARWNARAGTITKAIVPMPGAGPPPPPSSPHGKTSAASPGRPSMAVASSTTAADFLAMRTNLADQANLQNLLRQLKVDGLYPALDAANYSQHGGSVPGGYQFTMTGPGGALIYYTLDGTEPRVAGSSGATAVLTAGARGLHRCHHPEHSGDGQSPRLPQRHVERRLRRLFSVATEPASASNLVISELHYHPENPVLASELAVSPDKDDYEFIEVMNISPSASVDLTGIRFTAGITTTALGNQILTPGERAVFVKNQAAFNVRYFSLSPAPRVLGFYTGSLNNQGERVILNAGSGAVIRDFVFDDNAPWPDAADGSGMSLALIAPLTNPDHSLPPSWRGSTGIGGSPGTASFAAWKSAHGITGNTDDGDGDGLNALIEYLLGTNPGTPDNNSPLAGINGGFLTFTLTYRSADDAILTPQTSTALTGWSSAGIILESSTLNPNGTVTAVWKAPAGMAAAGRLFFRGLVQLQ